MSMLNPYNYKSILNSTTLDAEIIIDGLIDGDLIYYSGGLVSANVGTNLLFSGGVLSTSLTPSFTTMGGTLTTAAQAAITSVGTLTGLTMGGNIDMGGYTILNYSPTITGNLNMSGYNIINVGTLAGTLTTAAQTAITSVGTLTSLTLGGNLNMGTHDITNANDISASSGYIGNLTTSNLYVTNILTGFTMGNDLNMGGYNITNAGTLAGTLTTAAQTAITSVGTLTGLTMGGTLNLNSNNITNGGNISGTLTTAAQTAITSVGTLTGLTMGGTINLNYNKITNSSDASNNTQYGTSALAGLTNGYSNCCYGYQSLNAMTNGFYNTAVGYQSLKGVLNGYCNTAVGALAGLTVTTGINNVHIGYAADANNTNNSGQILIGYSVTSAVDNVCKMMNLTPGQGCFINSIKAGLAPYSLFYDASTYEIKYYSNDGWIDSSSSETWTYSSADAPTFVFNVNAKVDTKYSVGMKVRYVQSSTTKYGIITAVGAYSGGNTPITIYGGGGDSGTYTNATSYTMANSAITGNYYSFQKAPYGFPMNVNTWSYIMNNNQYYSITNQTTYVNSNVNTQSNIPIGNWIVKFTFLNFVAASADDHESWYALSTSTSSVSHTELSTYIQTQSYNWWWHSKPVALNSVINLTSKTIFYCIYKCKASRNCFYYGGVQPTIVRCICGYL